MYSQVDVGESAESLYQQTEIFDFDNDDKDAFIPWSSVTEKERRKFQEHVHIELEKWKTTVAEDSQYVLLAKESLAENNEIVPVAVSDDHDHPEGVPISQEFDHKQSDSLLDQNQFDALSKMGKYELTEAYMSQIELGHNIKNTCNITLGQYLRNMKDHCGMVCQFIEIKPNVKGYLWTAFPIDDLRSLYVCCLLESNDINEAIFVRGHTDERIFVHETSKESAFPSYDNLVEKQEITLNMTTVRYKAHFYFSCGCKQ